MCPVISELLAPQGTTAICTNLKWLLEGKGIYPKEIAKLGYVRV